MRKNYLLVFLLSSGLVFSASIFAQHTLTGTVTDAGSLPLIGVNILVKSTTSGTVTDYDGKYTLDVNEGDVLVFSYTGFQTQEFTIGTESVLDVTLEAGASLDEIVVVAYGAQKKVTVTGAVTQLQGREIIKSPAVDISNSLAGRLPGLVVIQTSGEPGYDGARINIRGTNTLGNNSPLIVIDGIPDRDGGLGRLNP